MTPALGGVPDWIPVTLAGVLASLRFAKGWLLALEYRTAAREGRIEPRR